jgi:hypothetical protein
MENMWGIRAFTTNLLIINLDDSLYEYHIA